jgi:hypothetical protein
MNMQVNVQTNGRINAMKTIHKPIGVSLALSAVLLALVAFNAGAVFNAVLAQSANKSTTTATTIFVAPTGNDSTGDGSREKPLASLAKAAALAQAGQTIELAAGRYFESRPAIVAVRVNIVGAGPDQTILDSSGVELAAGVDPNNKDFKLWYDGSLIQLISAPYPLPNPRYGRPETMLAAVDGSQSLAGFSIEGHKKLKAGVWVENRSNVTMHDVTIQNTKERGAVFAKGDMWWYEALRDDLWMKNTTLYNLNFINAGTDLADESLGNLCIGGLDGANIYNIRINDILGYGIKFIFVGHFRNVKIHDSNIRVSERDDKWGEDIAIELWNLDSGNEIYNIDANTWFSFVNQWQIVKYFPVGNETNRLKVYNNKIVDLDGLSGKESIEITVSGVEVYNNYFQDKGFGLAIWGFNYPLKNYLIHHNIFANPNPRLGFGRSAAVFVPDVATNINIYNNTFDRLGYALSLEKGRDVRIQNNVFLNAEAGELEKGSEVIFSHNLKFNRDPNKNQWQIGATTLGAGNQLGDPQFRQSGDRASNYYRPTSANSPLIGKGVAVGLAFSGLAPDIGALGLIP